MLYKILADAVVVIHFTFVLFVGVGGFLVLKWQKFAWVHVPVFLWGALISFGGWVCPLTPLENWLRIRGGGTGYSTTFIEHYIMPLLYPAHFTRDRQIVLGIAVLSVNFLIYAWFLSKKWR